ncbi:hypothetical protein MCOR31_004434 [Pyricularia oryzae]|nr:hypothetical protein MCOR31_004434 [Pyricularia oryzae]KAI6425346.1 hypothetical protein MCOR24_003133 [Pyricularia oryzae]KAI6570582.1 hypothetical protein MCOR09_004663 [Pyricularia oryzae]
MGIMQGMASRAAGDVKMLAAALSQDATNGKSKLGTFMAPMLPFFLANNAAMQHGKPWGDRTVEGTNPYRQAPTTGSIRSYDWTISRGTIAPDGYEVPALLINGQYPGPMIEANWGDTVQITVHNNITGPEEGTAMHWHGLLQRGTPYQDGVPGVTQCAIAPGQSYTYSFLADQFGSSWYHSHYSAQYSSGVVGPMVFYGPGRQFYDVDIGPVMLSDWNHQNYQDIIEKMLQPAAKGGNLKVTSDNNLINGKGVFDCSTMAKGDKTRCTPNAGYSKFKFQSGKVHRLRLMNTGSDGIQRFSIDEHMMTVIANDYVPIRPYQTKVVTLGVGQRADVLVKADQAPGSGFWMRSTLAACSEARQPNALAVVYYDEDGDTTPASKPWDVADPKTCANDDISESVPIFRMPVAQPTTTQEFVAEIFTNSSGVSLFKFGGVSARVDMNAPPLLLANVGNTSFPAEWNVHNFGGSKVVRLVVTNKTPGAHPMHLHGANVQVLAEGSGAWDGSTITNSDNPIRRDTQLVRPNGHVVLQFDADNAGVWPFHCHIAWHASAGYFSSVLTQPDLVKGMSMPMTIAQTCRDWAAYTQTNIPDQIDSGV